MNAPSPQPQAPALGARPRALPRALAVAMTAGLLLGAGAAPAAAAPAGSATSARPAAAPVASVPLSRHLLRAKDLRGFNGVEWARSHQELTPETTVHALASCSNRAPSARRSSAPSRSPTPSSGGCPKART